MEGLENAEDPVHAWWTDKMVGEEFPTVFSGYIKVCFTPTKDVMSSTLRSRRWIWDSGNPIWTATMMGRRFRFLCCIFEMMFSFCFRGVTGTGYCLVSSIV